jgi:hypothetical protein
MMDTINRMNTTIQMNNLAVQGTNGSDITITQVLIIIGIGLVLGGVVIAVMNWLFDR